MANLIYSAGTIANANANSCQNKIIFDGTRYWMFYMKSGTVNTLFYAYSTDLITWVESSVSLVNAYQDGMHLTVLFDPSTNVVLVFWMQGSGNYYHQYIRGVISTTTITWSAPISFDTSYNFSTANTMLGNAIKASDSKVIVTFQNIYTSYVYISKSTNVISTTLADTPFTTLGNVVPGSGINKFKIFALASNNYLLLAIDGGTPPYADAYRYNGTGWSSLAYIFGTPYTLSSGMVFDAAYISDISIFAIGQTGATALSLAFYNGSTWAAKTGPAWPTSGLATNSQVALVTDGTDLYAVLIRGDANKSVSYNKYTVSSDSWGGWTDLETSAQTRSYIAAAWLNGKLVATYQQTNGSNYDVYNATYAPPPVISSVVQPVVMVIT